MLFVCFAVMGFQVLDSGFHRNDVGCRNEGRQRGRTTGDNAGTPVLRFCPSLPSVSVFVPSKLRRDTPVFAKASTWQAHCIDQGRVGRKTKNEIRSLSSSEAKELRLRMTGSPMFRVEVLDSGSATTAGVEVLDPGFRRDDGEGVRK